MTALLLEPHHDDAVLFSCWNLLRYRPRVVTCLRSDRMASRRYPGGSVEHQTRVAETEQVAALLEVEWQQWGISDAAPDWDAMHASFSDLDLWDTPERVFAPAPEPGGHDHHNNIGQLALDVFGPERVTSYLTYTTEGRSTSGREVEFEPAWPVLKLRALACYESQIAHPATAPHFLGGLREYVA